MTRRPKGSVGFLIMNPGNGIETDELESFSMRNEGFLIMNPGNGIETNLPAIFKVELRTVSL